MGAQCRVIKTPPPPVRTRQSYELLYSPWEQRTSICVEVVLLLRHRREHCQCHRSVVSALNGAGASVRTATFLCKRLPSVRSTLCRRFYGTPSTPGKQETRSAATTEHIVSPNYCYTLYGRFCHKILGDTLARLLWLPWTLVAYCSSACSNLIGCPSLRSQSTNMIYEVLLLGLHYVHSH